MIKSVFCVSLLLICAIALSESSEAQSVFVLSHTNVETNAQGKFLFARCETNIQDADTAQSYPGGSSCTFTLNQNSAPIQTISCSNVPNTICESDNLDAKLVVDGANYQTTSGHGLIFQRTSCIQNGVLVACDADPLNYGLKDPSIAPIPPSRQIVDIGPIFPFGGPETFWIGGNINGGDNFLIGVSTETLFEAAQVIPFVLRVHACADPQTCNQGPTTFQLNGSQNANWTFSGVAGNTVPVAPSQGTSIKFQAPNTVPVQQVDTLTGCKVDTSHGTDCNSAQIIVEKIAVSILPGDPNVIPPPTNPTELLGGQSVQYIATVTQGAQIIPDSPVTWTWTDNSGLNLITVSPTGFVTVQPQSVFQGGNFFVDIQATSIIDPPVGVSGPFAIHIPTAAVQMTTLPSPGLNDTPTTFLATPGRVFNFAANVTGPINPQNRVITSWTQNFIPTFTDLSAPGLVFQDLNDPNAMAYEINSVPPKSTLSTVIMACVGGVKDAFSPGNLKNGTCAQYVLLLAPPVFTTSPVQILNGGESALVTVTGTGFGAAPKLTFADPNITFIPSSITGPDANGVTTVTGTMTVLPVPATEATTMTIISSLPPPTSPGTQPIRVRGEFLTPSVSPVSSTLLITQTQRFTGTLACKTINGLSCTVPQTFTCSISPAIGTMDPSTCTYTAPPSLTAATTVTGQACSTFGNQCTSFSISLVPVSVAISPATVSLDSAQSQQFQATVTNAPNNNQGVTWSINPAVGTVSASGLYTAPSTITVNQTITVSACSVVAPANCATGTINLFPPDFALSVPINASVSNPALSSVFDISLVPLHGFSGSVTLSAAVPAGIGMSANFSTTVIAGSGIAVLTVPVLSSTPVGTYNVTITGTSAGLVHTVPITVTVDLASITVTVSPPQTAPAGTTVSFTFNVTNTGFINVSDGLNITGVPPGSTVTPIAWGGSGGATLTFTTAPTLSPGTYQITITATANGLAGSAVTSLTNVVANNRGNLAIDGNFAVFGPANDIKWQTNTHGATNTFYSVNMMDDGNLIEYTPTWNTATPTSSGTASYGTLSCVGYRLFSGQTLASGACLQSPNKRFMLVMQTAGNLVLYDLSFSPAHAIFYNSTTGVAGSYLAMQGDGNLVIYTPSGTATWSTGTPTGSGSYMLQVQDPGNLVIYRDIWETGTSQAANGVTNFTPVSCSNIGPGIALNQNIPMSSCLISASGRFALVMQTDGNLVIYDRSVTPLRALWSTGTNIVATLLSPDIVLQTLYSYDVLGNLPCVEQHGTVSGSGCGAPASSDANSPWRVQRFSYDSLSRLITASNPESNTAKDTSGNLVRVPTVYAYDGNLLQKTSLAPNQTGTATQTISYWYNELHRVKGKAYSAQSCSLNSPVVTYSYDG